MDECLYTFTGFVGHDIPLFQLLQLQIKTASTTTLSFKLIYLIFGLYITSTLLNTFLLDILFKLLLV